MELEVSLTTVVIVMIVTLCALLSPFVASTVAVPSSPDRDSTELRATSVGIADSTDLVGSDFGAGTYHLTEFVVTARGLRGSGTVFVQFALPWYEQHVNSREFTVDEATGRDRTFRYQPQVEITPGVVKAETYPVRVTVRFQSASGIRIVAERTIRMEVHK
jgi:hypothetical protein